MFEITYKAEDTIYTDILGIDEIDPKSSTIESVVSVRCLYSGRTWRDNKAVNLLQSQIHKLKIHPEYFKAVKSGVKLFELRKDDRGFKVNDTLFLQEYNPITNKYTGRSTLKQIAYILHGGVFGLSKGFVILSFSESLSN